MPKDREFREKILAANPARRRLHKDEDNARRRLERDPGQWLRIRYGMTFEQRQPMFARQGRMCLIREQNPPEGLVVDHSHAARWVRGLLCRTCNLGLGSYRDDRP